MLTQLLRDNPDIADRLTRLALIESRDAMSATVAERLASPRTRNYALVGTAFDYLLRWEIERRNPVAKDRPWVASLALRTPMFDALDVPDVVRILYRSVVDEAILNHAGYVRTEGRLPGWQVRQAASECLMLARIDPLFRSGTIDTSVNEFDPLDVEDLVRLYDITPWAELGGAPGRAPLLNPEFGRVSTMFNGADADLIVDSTLVDFKTVLAYDMTKYLAQLMGYVAISDRYRETEDAAFPRLERAGIYFARHGKLVSFPLADVRTHPDWGEATTALFDAAVSAFGP